MALPKVLTATETSGNGSNATRVSTGSIDSINATDTTNIITVLAMYMMAGPTIMRTAFRSLVARDIRSPVRWAWK